LGRYLEQLASAAELFNWEWSYYAIIAQDLLWQLDNGVKVKGKTEVETFQKRIASAVENQARHGEALRIAFGEAKAGWEAKAEESPRPQARGRTRAGGMKVVARTADPTRRNSAERRGGSARSQCCSFGPVSPVLLTASCFAEVWLVLVKAAAALSPWPDRD
jgi:hypothetical protein